MIRIMVKKKIVNKANSFSLFEEFLAGSGQPTTKKGKEVKSENQKNTVEGGWTHFTVICSSVLTDKIKAIALKEGFTIREVVEKSFRDFISKYEIKNGVVKEKKKKKKKSVDDVL